MNAICDRPRARAERLRGAVASPRSDHRAEQQHGLDPRRCAGLDARQRRSSSTTVSDDRDHREQRPGRPRSRRDRRVVGDQDRVARAVAPLAGGEQDEHRLQRAGDVGEPRHDPRGRPSSRPDGNASSRCTSSETITVSTDAPITHSTGCRTARSPSGRRRSRRASSARPCGCRVGAATRTRRPRRTPTRGATPIYGIARPPGGRRSNPGVAARINEADDERRRHRRRRWSTRMSAEPTGQKRGMRIVVATLAVSPDPGPAPPRPRASAARRRRSSMATMVVGKGGLVTRIRISYSAPCSRPALPLPERAPDRAAVRRPPRPTT